MMHVSEDDLDDGEVAAAPAGAATVPSVPIVLPAEAAEQPVGE